MSEQKRAGRTVGIVGVVIGAIAFTLACVHFFEGPFEPPVRIEDAIADKAVDIKDAVVRRLKGETAEPEPMVSERSIDDWVRLAIIAFSTLAILLSVVSFLRREDPRASGSALALGAGALAFQFLMIAIGIIVLVAIIGAVLGNIDLDLFG